MNRTLIPALLLWTLSASLFSCTPSKVEPQDQRAGRLINTGGSWLRYENGLLTKLVNHNGGARDSTYLFYDQNKKLVNGVVRSKEDYHERMPFFLYYSGDRITKVYRKAGVHSHQFDYYNDPDYLFKFDPVTNRNDIYNYDSILYDSRGRVSAVYHKEGNSIIGEYETLHYNNPSNDPKGGGDSLLYLVQRYIDHDLDGTFDLRYKFYFHTYDLDKVNPLYKAFKEFALLYPYTSYMEVQPYWDITNLHLDRYMALNPHPAVSVRGVKIFTSETVDKTVTIYNTYNESGLLVSAMTTGFAGDEIYYQYE